MIKGKDVEIVLSSGELGLAAKAGTDLYISKTVGNARNNHGLKDPGWDPNLQGAVSEWAVAKALGVYYNPYEDRGKKTDVGGYQVRATSYKTGRLILREADNEDHDYILVITSDLPVCRLVGWINGKDCKRKEWLDVKNGRPPAWFVPQSALNPF